MNNALKDTLKMAVLLVVVVLTQMADARAVQAEDGPFTIQVGIFAGTSMGDFKALRKYGYVYTEDLSMQIKGVFLSNFESLETAEKTLANVKSAGFVEAFVLEKKLEKGKDVYVIQIATHRSYEDIDWQKYQAAGNVVMAFNESIVKVGIGPFDSAKAANAQMAAIKDLGYYDAFPKKTNNLLLHQLNDFDLGKPAVAPDRLPPTEYEADSDLAARTGEGQSVAAERPFNALEFSPPTSTSTAKRQSVKELQDFLKAQSLYNGAVDGIYGKGTAQGIGLFEENNQVWNNFELLAKNGRAVRKHAAGGLDALLRNIPNDPDGIAKKLTERTEPLAKAYRAFILLAKKDIAYQIEIDELMNATIQEVYKGYKGKAPFDYNATYSYKDMDQMLLHLGHIQQQSGDVPVPCWLLNRYPQQVTKAFGKNALIEDCIDFSQWQSLNMLLAIANDLDVTPAKDEAKMRELATQRAKLLYAPSAPSAQQKQSTETWHKMLWLAMDDWAKNDPFHAKYAAPLKLAYQQAWVQLEDYYINKGFAQPDANLLALGLLQTLLEPKLWSYTR
jgi:hypothetical protein